MWSFTAKRDAFVGFDEFVEVNRGKQFIVGFYETNDKGGGAFVDRKRITGRIYDPSNMRSPVWIFCVREDNGRATARIEGTRAEVRAEIEQMKAQLRAQGMLVEQDVVCNSRVEINSVAA
ncbi:hypothetical protein [Pseudomonas putida]